MTQLTLDTFQRADNATSWGTASDAGGAWNHVLGAGTVAIASGVATITGATTRQLMLSGSTQADVELYGLFSISATTDKGAYFFRETATNTTYLTQFNGTGSGIILGKVLASVSSNVTTATFTYTANTVYSMRVRIQGSTLQVKIWQTTTTEPVAWNISTTDTNITAAGGYGAQSQLAASTDIFSLYYFSATDLTFALIESNVPPVSDNLICTVSPAFSDVLTPADILTDTLVEKLSDTLSCNDSLSFSTSSTGGYVLVQSASAAAGSSGVTSLSVSPAPTGSGNLLVAYVYVYGSTPTITAPSGWTQIGTTQGSSAGVASNAMYYLQNSTSGITSFMWSFSATANVVIVFEEWSGVASSGALDQYVAQQNSKSTTSGTGTTAALAASGELAIWGIGASYSAALTFSGLSTGYTQDAAATAVSSEPTEANTALFYNTSVGAAATSSTCTMSAAGGTGNTTILAVFKPVTITTNTYTFSDTVTALESNNTTLEIMNIGSSISLLYVIRTFGSTLQLQTVSASGSQDTGIASDTITYIISATLAFADALTPSDTVLSTLITVQTNTLTSTDTSLFLLYNTLIDTDTALDTLSILSVFFFSENVPASESESVTAQWMVQDILSPLDTLSQAFALLFSDMLTPTDLSLTTLQEHITDSIPVQENIALAVTISFQDAGSVTDALTIMVLASLTDTLTTLDALTVSLFSSLSDTTSVNELLTIIGSTIVSFIESVTASDLLTDLLTVVASDTAFVSDTGSNTSVLLTLDTLTVNEYNAVTGATSASDTLLAQEIAQFTLLLAFQESIASQDTVTLTMLAIMLDTLLAIESSDTTLLFSASDSVLLSDIFNEFFSTWVLLPADNLLPTDAFTESLLQITSDTQPVSDMFAVSLLSIQQESSILSDTFSSFFSTLFALPADILTSYEAVLVALIQGETESVSSEESYSTTLATTLSDMALTGMESIVVAAFWQSVDALSAGIEQGAFALLTLATDALFMQEVFQFSATSTFTDTAIVQELNTFATLFFVQDTLAAEEQAGVTVMIHVSDTAALAESVSFFFSLYYVFSDMLSAIETGNVILFNTSTDVAFASDYTVLTLVTPAIDSLVAQETMLATTIAFTLETVLSSDILTIQFLQQSIETLFSFETATWTSGIFFQDVLIPQEQMYSAILFTTGDTLIAIDILATALAMFAPEQSILSDQLTFIEILIYLFSDTVSALDALFVTLSSVAQETLLVPDDVLLLSFTQFFTDALHPVDSLFLSAGFSMLEAHIDVMGVVCTGIIRGIVLSGEVTGAITTGSVQGIMD